MLSSSMMHAITLIGKVFLSTPHPPTACSIAITAAPTLVTGQYLLSNLSTLAQMDGCSLKVPIMMHVHMIY